MSDNTICVVGAAVERDGHVLLCRRAPGEREAGFWEFPGGKVHDGETEQQSLARELREELGVEACVEGFVAANTHRYGQRTIQLNVYRCKCMVGEIALTVHDAAEWVALPKLLQYRLAPADIPIARQLVADSYRHPGIPPR